MPRMYADFSDEAYEDLKNGEAMVNNGFRKSTGAFHPDQPNYSDIEDDDKSSSTDAGEIVALAVVGGFALGTILAPHIKKFWNNTVTPRVNKLFKKNKGKEKSDSKENTFLSTNVLRIKANEEISAEQFSNSIDMAIEGFQENMSSEEAQIHMLNIMKLAEMLARELRSLSGVVVKKPESSPDYLEWRNAFEKLTTQQVTDGLNYMLENNSSLFQGETLQDMAWIWGKDDIKEGELIPINNIQIKKALTL